MTARRQVVIDVFPESLVRYAEDWAVVAVDILRATTTAVTAVSRGRKVFPVATAEQARATAALLADALLVGERGGVRPEDFDENNSPAAIAARMDVHRPMVLLSTSGTRLLQHDGRRVATYAACLRNVSATVAHVASAHDRVAVIGAGTRGEFREEDALGCAWVAEGLVDAGFVADAQTSAHIAAWSRSPVTAITRSKSADYLRRSGQVADLQFVLEHVEDVPSAVAVQRGELVALSPLEAAIPQGVA